MNKNRELSDDHPLATGMLDYTTTLDSVLRSASNNPFSILLANIKHFLKTVFYLNQNRKLAKQKIAAMRDKVAKVESDISSVHKRTVGGQINRLR